MPAKPIPFGNFTGLDLRENKETSPIRSLRQATNVDLTRGGGVTKRAGLRPVVTLDSKSKGLYVLNGSLRALAPSGQSVAGSALGEVSVLYDVIGTEANVSYSTGTIAVTNGSRTITLTAGTWPTWIDGSSTLSVGAVTIPVTIRNSGSIITLEANYTGITASGLTYSVYGTQAVAYPLSTISRVAAVEGIGQNAAFGLYPYVCIEKASGQFEHHWITSVPATTATPVKTQVNLPFQPGNALIKHQEKLWANDNVNGVIRFSSTANGPSDWTQDLDAGYIPVAAYITGSRSIQGLGVYDDKLAVLFSDATQLWEVAPDPALISFKRLLDGSGTEAPSSVQNVLGDLFYFSQGGFRSLKTVALTGQIKEDDSLGGPIFPLTSVLDVDTYPPVAVWSQSRGQYLCAIGSTIYAYRYSPAQKIIGWTTYEAAGTVAALVEFDGFVYLRVADTVYRLDPDYDDGCAFTVQPAWTDGRNSGRLTRYDFLELIQTGACDVAYLTDPRNDAVSHDGPTISGTTTPLPLIAMGVCSQALSLVFTGTDPTWQLDRFTLYATPLGR